MGSLPINDKPIYYVRENESSILSNSYLVYCHHPRIFPDDVVDVFTFEEEAEIFCKILNAESQGLRWNEYKEVK